MDRRVLNAITSCRTSALGGHVLECDRCRRREVSYNSCRNRHCPKCQARARGEWLEEKRRWLLPIEYYHVVFTIPQALARIAQQNKKCMYAILFRAASETLRDLSADPKHLGAEIGVLAVLHTWGQNLHHHPHVHCIVSGGGLSPDRSRWVPCRPGFFLPVRVLSRMFRGKFLDHLRRAYRAGELEFFGQLAELKKRSRLQAYLDPLYKQEWVVYAKPPFGGPERVLKYLARYTHRVAISNQRLVSLEDGAVSFIWKDYERGGKRSVMRLDAIEFLRRFLLHTLPKGFVRVRAYGFLANRSRKEKLARCQELLGAQDNAERHSTDGEDDLPPECNQCEDGHMICILAFDRIPPAVLDSS